MSPMTYLVFVYLHSVVLDLQVIEKEEPHCNGSGAQLMSG